MENLTNNYSRRNFLKTGAIFTGGLLIPFSITYAFKKNIDTAASLMQKPGEEPLKVNSFLQIGNDNSVKVILTHCEMGQGIWTALPMLINEELDADWNSITVEHAPADVKYYHTVYGTQRTGGSSSLMSEFDRYRQVGATARYMLIAAAAKKYGVSPADCRTEKGHILIKDKRIPYGEVADIAAKLPIPEKVALKDPTQWKYITKGVKRLDTVVKTNGKAIFGIDVQFPGLLTAMVARNVMEGAKVKSYDKAAALRIAGVREVVVIPQGVAVLADNFWAAKKGREALNVQWDLGANSQISSAGLLADYKKRADQGGPIAVDQGNLAEAFKKSARIVEAEYFQPYLAHAPMEPLNVTVQLTKDKCEIWTGTQTQTDDQKAASDITGLPLDKVVINTVFLGGSFGRRNITRSDFVREAVEVAKASGKVVKTVWTREDDIQGGMYRPAFLHRFKVGIDSKGMPSAWKQVSVGQSYMTGGPFEKYFVINGVDLFSIEGMQEAVYVAAVKDKKIELNTPVLPIPIDNWRAVGLSHTIFAMESLTDELAYAAGMDPMAYRHLIYKDDPRLIGVLKAAEEKSQWGSPLPKGQARGVAVFRAVSSFAAVVLEISVSKSGIKVNKATCAIDCGVPVNPEGIKAQIESNIVYGISAALYNEITFKDGMVEQNNFYDYKVLRMNEMPVVETIVIESSEKPGGIGEAAVSQTMPALTNAIYAATGKRIRTLPILNQKFI
ncbi:xanthine dehydrogenase family protein molybdopterin-binding subunit [Flavobacterium sp. F52]|uniref:xanthine dehydrogenase family protein molybdopterin-binding subunit n=1 Tax=Flavobacterium sp. F52 TaxID=1202532 RepID=UPI000272DBEC|nr:xanthine dehydrogenase family protein molybdopterin-binding subunit [Flavobacterium sp. F52]EJG03198.1 molybdopterin-binding aldehyde oxidase and xanthine dehydrogenase [Flavobacterium sp. F52]